MLGPPDGAIHSSYSGTFRSPQLSTTSLRESNEVKPSARSGCRKQPIPGILCEHFRGVPPVRIASSNPRSRHSENGGRSLNLRSVAMCRLYERPPTVGDNGASICCVHRQPCARCNPLENQQNLVQHLNATISKLFAAQRPRARKSRQAAIAWRCDLCNFTTSIRREKTFHLRCHKVSVIDCVDCGLGFSTIPELREHRRKSICRKNSHEPSEEARKRSDRACQQEQQQA